MFYAVGEIRSCVKCADVFVTEHLTRTHCMVCLRAYQLRPCRSCHSAPVVRAGRCAACAERSEVRRQAIIDQLFRTYACLECGTAFVPIRDSRYYKYCSPGCMKKVNRRITGAARAARKRGNDYEPIDPLLVLARDGWRCQLCGCPTPKRLRGTVNSKAPEVDHIVPLAAGGTHTWDNVQCACRRCNRVKYDKPLGQARLSLTDR